MLPELRIGVSVLVLAGGYVLMGRRKGSHGAGTWSFPGGHNDPGETLLETARRELQEETGIRLDPALLKPHWFVENHFEAEGERYVTLYFKTSDLEGLRAIGTLTPRLLEPNKCEAWVWVPTNDLPKPLFAPIEAFLRLDRPFG